MSSTISSAAPAARRRAAATPAAPVPLFLTVRAAAARLGVSYWMVLDAIRAGTLPARKLSAAGKSWYVHADDLDAFARGTLPSNR